MPWLVLAFTGFSLSALWLVAEKMIQKRLRQPRPKNTEEEE